MSEKKQVRQLQLTDSKQMFSTDTLAQRLRILKALIKAKGEGITTLEARKELDILHPAGRIMELRKQGFQIETLYDYETTDVGKLHRVARYVFIRNTFGGDNAKR